MLSLAANKHAAALNGVDNVQMVADEMLTLVTCVFNDTGDDDKMGNDCYSQAVAEGSATTKIKDLAVEEFCVFTGEGLVAE